MSRTKKPLSNSRITNRTACEETSNDQYANFVVVDIQLSNGYIFHTAENQGMFSLFA
jgi:hypothetical protein